MSSDLKAALQDLESGQMKDPWAFMMDLGVRQAQDPQPSTTLAVPAAVALTGAAAAVAVGTKAKSQMQNQPTEAPQRATYGRRQFLGFSFRGALAFVAVGGSSVGLLTACTANPWTQIAAMGSQYIGKVPAEGDFATLKGLLGNPADTSNPAVLLKNLNGQINTDFANGTGIYITCLYLTSTQWRICAWWNTHPAPTTTTTGGTTTTTG